MVRAAGVPLNCKDWKNKVPRNALGNGDQSISRWLHDSRRHADFRLIFYSLGMPSACKLLISLRAVVEYFKM
jgi:hypothetical protein